MSDASDDFRKLIEQARLGDETALTTLMQRYQFELRLASRAVLGPALRPYLDSIDLTQSVHGAMMEGLRQGKFTFNDADHLVALVVTLVRRKAARHWRQLQRQRRVNSWDGQADGGGDALVRAENRETDPAEVAAIREQWNQTLDSLNADERQLIERRLEGYSTAEVARQMGVDADVLRVRLRRLRQRLTTQGLVADWL